MREQVHSSLPSQTGLKIRVSGVQFPPWPLQCVNLAFREPKAAC